MPPLNLNSSMTSARSSQAIGRNSDMCYSDLSGIQVLKNSKYCKGLTFSIEERQLLGIHGLLPPVVRSQKQQVDNCLRNLRRYEDPLNKYVYLNDLLCTNERLFYKLLSENVEELMPIVYTPTVGLACQQFGYIFSKPQGLFITIHDKGHIYDILCNWPEWDVKVIVVTDGERILGLGDLGANGMGIPIGKLSLYSALAGIKPHQTLPIMLDVGTNRQELLESEDYIGLRHSRVTGRAYDEFIDEFMHAIVRKYGQNTLIQFEDFGNANAFRLLDKYRSRFCTFNDDIQGTASVAVAGILAALKATKTRLQDHTFLFQGAGEAAIGIANLLVMAMEKYEGISRGQAIKKIWMKDSKGLIVQDRPEGGISEHKAPFAQDHAPLKDLAMMVKIIRPTALIGAAAIGGVFNQEIIELMSEFNDQPIIFALSNPTSKAECTAEEAYKYSKGKAVFASGSPFAPLEMNGKKFEPGQGNNAYIFPGVGLGAIAVGIHHIQESVFLSAAQALADLVTPDDLKVGRMYPPLSTLKECSIKIAIHVAKEALENGTASVYPKPRNVEKFIQAQLYDYDYDDQPSSFPRYSWNV